LLALPQDSPKDYTPSFVPRRLQYSATHCVRGGMTYSRVRQRGKRWAAGEGAPLPVTPSPPPIFSIFYPVCGAPFHETRERRAEPPTASARRSEKGCPTAPQSATVRRPCRRHDTRRQAQITPHKRSAVWGVRVRCRGQRVGDTPLSDRCTKPGSDVPLAR